MSRSQPFCLPPPKGQNVSFQIEQHAHKNFNHTESTLIKHIENLDCVLPITVTGHCMCPEDFLSGIGSTCCNASTLSLLGRSIPMFFTYPFNQTTRAGVGVVNLVEEMGNEWHTAHHKKQPPKTSGQAERQHRRENNELRKTRLPTASDKWDSRGIPSPPASTKSWGWE